MEIYNTKENIIYLKNYNIHSFIMLWFELFSKVIPTNIVHYKTKPLDILAHYPQECTHAQITIPFTLSWGKHPLSCIWVRFEGILSSINELTDACRALSFPYDTWECGPAWGCHGARWSRGPGESGHGVSDHWSATAALSNVSGCICVATIEFSILCLKCIVLFYSSEPIRETRACLRAIRMLSECGVLCCDVSRMRGYQVSRVECSARCWCQGATSLQRQGWAWLCG